MKIEVNPDKNMFGKKIGFVASFGEWKEKGKTKEEAKQNLIDAMEWYFSESDYSINFKSIPSAGVTLILKRTFDGYQVITTYHDGSNTLGSSNYGRISFGKALEYLNSHVANYMEHAAI